MNTFKGVISEIKSTRELSIIYVHVGTDTFKSIIINNSNHDPGLVKGQDIKVMFKESEVFLGKGWKHKISLQNQLFGKVSKIKQGEIIAEVTIETEIGTIVSIITMDAVNNLKLSQQDEVTAMIKTNEILLSH